MTTTTDRALPDRPAHSIRLLLRKDLRLFTGGDALILLGAYMVFAFQFVRYDEAFFWLSVCLAAAAVLAVPFVEWLVDSDVTLSSLPVRRSTIVVARYVAAAGACAAAAAIWIASGRLLGPLLSPARTGAPSWETVGGVLAYLAAATGLVAIFLPLYFRWALGRAVMALGPVCLVLLAISSTIAPLVGVVPIEGAPLAPPSAVIRHGMEGLVVAAGPLAAVMLTLAGVGATWSASCWLSVRGFERRDL